MNQLGAITPPFASTGLKAQSLEMKRYGKPGSAMMKITPEYRDNGVHE